jgi:hypothetical protein
VSAFSINSVGVDKPKRYLQVIHCLLIAAKSKEALAQVKACDGMNGGRWITTLIDECRSLEEWEGFRWTPLLHSRMGNARNVSCEVFARVLVGNLKALNHERTGFVEMAGDLEMGRPHVVRPARDTFSSPRSSCSFELHALAEATAIGASTASDHNRANLAIDVPPSRCAHERRAAGFSYVATAPWTIEIRVEGRVLPAHSAHHIDFYTFTSSHPRVVIDDWGAPYSLERRNGGSQVARAS